jgi:predicted PurR-regulated permease PerM
LLIIACLYLAGLIWQIAAQFSDIILLFFLAWVVAFILEPAVDALQRQALLPRPIAVAVAYLSMLVIGATATISIVPALSRQTIQLASELPAYLAMLSAGFLDLQATLNDRGLTLNLAALLQVEDLVRRAEAIGPPVLSNAVTLATQIATFVIQLVLVLILSFYVMLDGPRIKRNTLGLVPIAFRDDVEYFVASVNRAFAGFLRGQLIQALIYAIGTAAIMSAAGLDLIVLTAVVNTALMLIPFVGPPLALVLPLLIAIFEKPGSFWIMLILVNVLQQVVVNVVGPRVMSSAVGVHPLLVFLVILAGAKVAGVWGALFGVPVMAVIAAMVTFYHALLEERRLRAAEAALAEANIDELAASARDAVAAGRVPSASGVSIRR